MSAHKHSTIKMQFRRLKVREQRSCFNGFVKASHVSHSLRSEFKIGIFCLPALNRPPVPFNILIPCPVGLVCFCPFMSTFLLLTILPFYLELSVSIPPPCLMIPSRGTLFSLSSCLTLSRFHSMFWS